MLAIDASSIIHGWDNYPIDNFPPFWEWLGSLISSGEVIIPVDALTEVGHMSPECHSWVVKNGIERIVPTNEILRKSLIIKNLLGIEGDDFHADGVDGNDIRIIATAWDGSSS